MTRILMVCLGNICRSPLAHGILESILPTDTYYVDSAGTGNYHVGAAPDQRSIEIARINGIDISRQKCRQFKISDFDSFDVIYVMDESNYKNVADLARDQQDISKVKLILNNVGKPKREVPDPYYGNDNDFANVFNLLQDACITISDQLQSRK